MYISKIHIEAIKKLETDSVFNSMEWISIFDENKIQLLGVFNKNKELIGCFYHYNYKRGKVFTQISPPPFSPNCGLFIADKTSNPAQKNTFKKKTLQLIRKYIEEQKYDILDLSFPYQYIDMQEFIWKEYTVEPRYSYQLNLNDTEEELISKMSSERRKNIRKAQKDGVYTQKVTNIELAKKLIYNTYSKQNLTVDNTVLDKIFNSFSTPENTICFVSYDKNKNPLSTVFCVVDKTSCYYILGGYSATKKHEGAGALAMWEAIKEAKNKKIAIFDFEGSMLPQVEKYFRGFGGNMIPFYSIKKNKFKGTFFLTIRKMFNILKK